MYNPVQYLMEQHAVPERRDHNILYLLTKEPRYISELLQRIIEDEEAQIQENEEEMRTNGELDEFDVAVLVRDNTNSKFHISTIKKILNIFRGFQVSTFDERFRPSKEFYPEVDKRVLRYLLEDVEDEEEE